MSMKRVKYVYQKNEEVIIMYVDVKEGVKRAKDGGLVFKTFGVLAAILLVLFLLCTGITKIVFGVLLALDVLFILAVLFMCFVIRGSKKDAAAIRERLNEDLKTFQNVNKEFVKEFCTWYIAWQDKVYGKPAVDSSVAMHLALNLHITKLDTMSVFEKCEKMYFAGQEIKQLDKFRLLELAQRLNNSNKDSERDAIKKEIVEVMQSY